jgi:hypothetical protein
METLRGLFEKEPAPTNQAVVGLNPAGRANIQGLTDGLRAVCSLG